MKVINQRRSAGMLLVAGMVWMLGIFAPAPVEGAVAHAGTSAEVVEPGRIDLSPLLAAAAAGAAPATGNSALQEVQPEVRIIVVDGVTFLTVDYN